MGVKINLSPDKQKQIPEDQCKHCLPDCTTTKYESSMTYAGLRKCDRTNLGGTSMLCSLVDGSFNPPPWMATAQEDFKDANQTIPWYLNTNSLPANPGLKSILTLDPYTFARVAGLPSMLSSSPTKPFASGHNLLNFETDIV